LKFHGEITHLGRNVIGVNRAHVDLQVGSHCLQGGFEDRFATRTPIAFVHRLFPPFRGLNVPGDLRDIQGVQVVAPSRHFTWTMMSV